MIKVTNEKQLLKTIEKYHLKKRVEAAKVVEKTSLKVVNRAKLYAPVKYGELRGSITILERRSDGLGTDVGTNVEYAKDLEYGTPILEKAHGKHDPEHPVTQWKAKKEGDPRTQMPFLRPALLDYRKEFISNLMKIFSKVD